jgi:hypothetical protein
MASFLQSNEYLKVLANVLKALKRALLVWFCHSGEIGSFLETICLQKT